MKSMKAFFGKKNANVGFDVDIVVDGVDKLTWRVAGFDLSPQEKEHLLWFAVQRKFQNITNEDKTLSDVKESWKEVERNLEQHGRLSVSTGRRGDKVESRAKGLVARILQEQGMAARDAIAAVSAIWNGEKPPKDLGLPEDIQEKAREKARALLAAEQDLLNDLL